MSEEDLSDDERRALEFIRSQDGVLQSELWKELDASSRKGSRLARSLAEKGLVSREETVHDGRTTYRLIPTDASAEQPDSPQPPVEDELSDSESTALELIRSRGGVLQSELWKELDSSSRKGSRIARSLAESGLITREDTVYEGRTTYRLLPTETGSADDEQRDSESADSAEDPDADGRSTEELEREALELVESRNGIHQSEFWKELDVSSRKGSRIASSLEEQGVIRRVETTYGGQRTYFLHPAAKELNFSLLMAGDEISPLIQADGDVDPIASNEFSQWVLQLAQESR